MELTGHRTDLENIQWDIERPTEMFARKRLFIRQVIIEGLVNFSFGM